MTGGRGKSFSEDRDKIFSNLQCSPMWELACLLPTVARCLVHVLLLRPVIMLQIRLRDVRPRRHTAGQPHIATNR